MKVLVGCEFSGIVRDAFIARGHDALSCDFEETESPGPHIVGDVLEVLNQGWDLMIAHPPCTYMANSANKHLYIGKRKENGFDPERWGQMVEAALFFKYLLSFPIDKIAIENPVMNPYAKDLIGERQTQTIQPYQFGVPETKRTCLWLKNLPNLQPTEMLPPPYNPKCHFESPGPRRWKNRSRTVPAIAAAMAAQWG